MIPVPEWTKAFHTSDCAAPVIGTHLLYLATNHSKSNGQALLVTHSCINIWPTNRHEPPMQPIPWVVTAGVKRLELEALCSSSSTIGFKKWKFTPAVPYAFWLETEHIDDFTFII
jgi:hypothetical protein